MSLEELIDVLELIQGSFEEMALNQYFAAALLECKEAQRGALNLQGDTDEIGRNYVKIVQAPNILRYLNEHQKVYY